SAIGVFANAANQVGQLGRDDSLAKILMSEAKAAEKMVVKEMPERSVADVVEQSCQPHQAFDVSRGGDGFRLAGLHQKWIKTTNRSATQVHSAENVLKAGMLRAGINPPSALQLMNPPEALHPRMIDERLLGRLGAIASRGEGNVTVQRIADQTIGIKIVTCHWSFSHGSLFLAPCKIPH